MKISHMMAAALLGCIGFAGLSSTAAEARDYPFCIRGQYALTGGGDGLNCSFDTLAQCYATASGAGGSCTENPFYMGSRAQLVPGPVKHRKHTSQPRQY